MVHQYQYSGLIGVSTCTLVHRSLNHRRWFPPDCVCFNVPSGDPEGNYSLCSVFILIPRKVLRTTIIVVVRPRQRGTDEVGSRCEPSFEVKLKGRL